MAKRRSEKTISLFPFLAVLVCTMGALILLLLVTTRRIRQKQQEHSVDTVVVETASPPVDVAEPDVSEEDWQQAKMALTTVQKHRADMKRTLSEQTQEYEAALSQLQDDQQNLAELERDWGIEQKKVDAAESATVSYEQQHFDLKQQQTELQNRLDELGVTVRESKEKLESAEALAVAGEQLVSQRFSALQALRDLNAQQRDQVANSGVAETAIEFSNSTGTSKTPIIVDLTEYGFIFPATQIRIRRKEMDGISPADNPLLSGVLAIHRERSNDSFVSRPYVLLLVRPGGTLGFYVAQRVLKEANIHFGYELISDEEVIAAAKPVNGEAEAVRVAVSDSLMRRDRYLEATSMLRRRIAVMQSDRRGGRNQPLPAAGDHRTETGRRMYGEPIVYSDAENPLQPYANSDAPENPATGLDRDANPPMHPNIDSQRSPAAEHSGWSSAASDNRQGIPSAVNVQTRIEVELAKALAAREQSRVAASLEKFGSLMDSAKRPAGEASIQPPGRTQFNASEPSVAASSNDAVDDRDHTDEFWSAMQPLEASPSRNSSTDHGYAQMQSQTDRPVHPPTLDGQTYRPYDTSPDAAARLSSSGGRRFSMSAKHGGRVGGLVSYEQVTIFLDPQHYTIVGQNPVRLHGQSIRRIVQSLARQLFEISSEHPHSLAQVTLPSAKFVVSPGAHTLYLQLAAALHDMSIPVASVVSMDAHARDRFEDSLSVMGSVPQTAATPASRQRELP